MAPPEPLPCTWCRGLGDAVCHGCNHCIHLRPHCCWNCGHAAYLPSAAHVVQLCPDCAFCWLFAVAASPLRPVHPPMQAALRAHMESVLSQVQPRAGHGVALPPALSNRRIEWWLLCRFLQRRDSPVTVSAALAACDDALGSPSGLPVGCHLCLQNLRREGGLVLTVVVGELLLFLCFFLTLAQGPQIHPLPLS